VVDGDDAMSAGFTPGPWAIHPTIANYVIVPALPVGGPIADAPIYDSEAVPREASLANAQLIAAAPELYEALEAANASMGDGRYNGLLRKARGEVTHTPIGDER
jgi:hypothetical protein